MARKPLAVLDTSVVLFALSDPESGCDEDAKRQIVAVTDKLAALQKTHRFGLPAVVVAELGRDGDTEATVAAIISEMPDLSVLALGYEGGLHAACLRQEALRKRTQDRTRGAVTYDALVFATALEHGADCILTENGEDFRPLL